MDRIPEDIELLKLESADEVADFAHRVYGGSLNERGLLHAASLRLGNRGRHRTQPLNDNGDCKCLHASLAKQLTRARADAIFTTRDVLVRHPDLDHRLSGPGRWPEALSGWRREHLAKSTEPITFVLSPDPDLDLDHRVFSHWTRPVVFTTREAHWELESRAADRGIEVVGVDQPTAIGGIEFLRHAFGAATIALETGVDTLRKLCQPTLMIDELALALRDTALRDTVLHGGRPEDLDTLDELFLPPESLVRWFPQRSSTYRIKAAGETWSLQRLRR